VKPRVSFLVAVGSALALASCGEMIVVPESPEMSALVGGTDRPFGGVCTIAVVARVHEEGEEEEGQGGKGGCGGGHETDEGGGPPISRHYEISGSCQLAHLGRSAVSGRLNLTGPLGGGHAKGDGQGAVLGARGRLAFVAANGDQLTGRYLPVSAVFTPAVGGDGGMVVFTATQQIGESCSGHETVALGSIAAAGHDEEEPVSTGRFVAARGEATLLGRVSIRKSIQRGSGTITISSGLLSY